MGEAEAVASANAGGDAARYARCETRSHASGQTRCVLRDCFDSFCCARGAHRYNVWVVCCVIWVCVVEICVVACSCGGRCCRTRRFALCDPGTNKNITKTQARSGTEQRRVGKGGGSTCKT